MEFRLIEFRKILRSIKTTSVFRVNSDWLDEIGRHELGEKWEEEVKALNVEAKVVLRVNTLKISVTELKKAFTEQEIETETVKGVPDALVLSQRQNIFSTSQFKNGFLKFKMDRLNLLLSFYNWKVGCG